MSVDTVQGAEEVEGRKARRTARTCKVAVEVRRQGLLANDLWRKKSDHALLLGVVVLRDEAHRQDELVDLPAPVEIGCQARGERRQAGRADVGDPATCDTWRGRYSWRAAFSGIHVGDV